MAAHHVDLALALKPLEVEGARAVLVALAHWADDDGECGEVPMARLTLAAQLGLRQVGEALIYLESVLGLIVKVEQGTSRPSRFRVLPDRLANPTAHLPVERRTFKIIGGPLAGQHVVPPDLSARRIRALRSSRSLYPNRALIYQDPMTEGRFQGVYEPITFTHGPAESGEVYRLGEKAWLHSGTTLRVLHEHGVAHRTLAQLRLMDLHTVPELESAVGSWRRYGVGDTPFDFAQFLHGASAYLDEDSRRRRIPVTVLVAESALRALDLWRDTRAAAGLVDARR